jgi:NADH:ubiquinone oxidoreductase subunit
MGLAEWMSTLQIRWFTLRRGVFVANDAYGNRYYRDKKATPLGHKERRWVLFHGEIEASKVPPEWHGWLHHTHDAPLVNDARKTWVLPHQANMTGTPLAYRPPGHQLAGGQRAKATGDYEAWTP